MKARGEGQREMGRKRGRGREEANEGKRRKEEGR